jgi:spermidine/putrescine transport system substrate-binding protein
MSPAAGLLAGAATLLVALGAAACGSSDEQSAVAPPPADPDDPATGTLSVFAYQDTVTDELLEPFREQNPELELRTATFGSNQEAAAKLAGGFEADAVEVCLDEISPLTARNLLRPLDPEGITDWDRLVFRDSPGVRDGADVLVVPLSAGPQGLIYDAGEVGAGEVDSFADLFDPAFADRVALEADYPLPAIAETALALGIEDPMNLSPEEPLWKAMADFSRGDDAVNKAWSVGQVAGLITRCPSVQEIIEDIITGFKEASYRLQKISSFSP